MANLAHGFVNGARGGHDHGLEACRKAPAEIRHMAVVGPNHSDFEIDIGEAHDADPGCRDLKMHVGALVVHILDAVLGLIVLHPWPGLPGPTVFFPPLFQPVNALKFIKQRAVEQQVGKDVQTKVQRA